MGTRRRVLACCEPTYAYSALRWEHASSCQKRPQQRVFGDEWIWTSEAYPYEEQERHEAQARADLNESGCPVHNGFQPWDECPGCEAQIVERFG